MAGNDDWRDALIGKYPRYFANDAGVRTGWPEVDDGWRDLLETALARIDSAVRADPRATFRVEQIKSKFGGLRLYASGNFGSSASVADGVERAIDLAEARSVVTCEMCGNEGRLYESDMGWFHTACADHGKGRLKERDPRRAGVTVWRKYVDGELKIVGCKRYLRETDEFVDVDPASIGLED